MPFYSFEMILVGIILLSAMMAGGISLWIKKRKSPIEKIDSENNLNSSDLEKTKKLP